MDFVFFFLLFFFYFSNAQHKNKNKTPTSNKQKNNETTKEIRQYLLSYTNNHTFEWQKVCSNPPTDKMEYRNMNKAAALVFEGDRVDGKGKTVGEPDPIYFKQGIYRSPSWTITHTMDFGPVSIGLSKADVL